MKIVPWSLKINQCTFPDAADGVIDVNLLLRGSGARRWPRHGKGNGVSALPKRGCCVKVFFALIFLSPSKNFSLHTFLHTHLGQLVRNSSEISLAQQRRRSALKLHLQRARLKKNRQRSLAET
jgi:hypothetical protein